MHKCKSGKMISNDSIIAFVVDNANDPSHYAINNGSLIYNDHNGVLRIIDLDLIPVLDDTEEFFTPPTVRHRRRRLQHTAMPEPQPEPQPKPQNDDVDEFDPKRLRNCIEKVVSDFMKSDCGYKQIVDAIYALISTIINMDR